MLIRIKVEKLFGMHDYEISLNNEEGITIIYGMNGSGKTSLLNMISLAIHHKYDALSKYKFQEFNLYFEDMEVLFNNSEDNLSVKFKVFEDGLFGNKHQGFTYNKKHDERIRDWVRYVDINDNLIENIRWVENKNESEMDYINHQIFKYETGIRKEKKIENKLNQLIESRISVHFIETQRLLDLKGSDFNNKKIPDKKRIIEYVEKYSEDLSLRIQKSLTEYSEISQKLDKTFPQRLLKQGMSLNENELRNKLVELENKRTQLGKAGILEENDKVEFIIPNNIGEQDLKVLTVYAEDVESKLSKFDTLLNKIEALLKLLRFSNKEVLINKDDGFYFKNNNGDKILPKQLSSGEQHELVIMYQLIFMLNDNVLVLIDEPELSLHIVWQKVFIDNLREVMKNTKLKVLIATHSPQIINNNWDCTVSLDKGVDK